MPGPTGEAARWLAGRGVRATGAETIVLMRLGGEQLLGRVAPDVRLRPGSSARFALDTRRICLFDPSTDRLIA